jgi:nifR3 family TIM-barrel protein
MMSKISIARECGPPSGADAANRRPFADATSPSLDAARRAEPFAIGRLAIRRRVLPAPMCGISDRAQRTMSREMGCELTYTQMFSAEGVRRNDRHTWDLIDIEGEPAAEGPVAVQLFGADPEALGESARMLANRGVALIDLNMGCPARKVTGSKCGSALMREPELVRDIARAMRAGAGDVPFTVKMRAGWDKNHRNMTEIAEIVEGEGVDAICLHPRTKEERFAGRSEWELIGELKQSVRIPVIGNGDVQCGGDAERMMAETGCDAVMVGRGSMGRPWVLRDCLEVLHPGEMASEPRPYTTHELGEADYRAVSGMAPGQRYDPGATIPLEDRLRLLRRHAELMVQWKGEERGLVEFRKHGVQYVRGLHHASRFKDAFLRLKEFAALIRLLDQAIEECLTGKTPTTISRIGLTGEE